MKRKLPEAEAYTKHGKTWGRERHAQWFVRCPECDVIYRCCDPHDYIVSDPERINCHGCKTKFKVV